MTTPASDRARFILSECLCLGQDESIALIASAITQAEEQARKEALAPYENMVCFDRDRYLAMRERERAALKTLLEKD